MCKTIWNRQIWNRQHYYLYCLHNIGFKTCIQFLEYISLYVYCFQWTGFTNVYNQFKKIMFRQNALRRDYNGTRIKWIDGQYLEGAVEVYMAMYIVFKECDSTNVSNYTSTKRFEAWL